MSIGIVANIYNEVNALPGWLEMATSFADHVAVYHAGPGGKWSDDGTMELLEKWKIPVHRGSIDDGFGIVRTATVRCSPCDWVMLLDADERFYQFAPVVTCAGTATPGHEAERIIQSYDSAHRRSVDIPSNWENMAQLGKDLTTSIGEIYPQGAWLRSIIDSEHSWDAVTTIRRHWHDFSWKRPTQNFHEIPDYQTRIMRNRDNICFDPMTKMHESLHGAPNRAMPNGTHGPFFDHYHIKFKAMEPEQRGFDLRVYDAIHFGTPMPE